MAVTLTKHFIMLVAFIGLTNFQMTASADEYVNSRQVLELTLAEHRGEVIYLDFWASWCVPCRKSFPWLNTLNKKYQGQGFTVISVNLDANQALAKQFLIENPLSFAVIYDPKGKIAKHFDIRGMPSSLLIGRDGKIMQRHTGFFTEQVAEYQHEIEQLLEHNR